MDFSLISVRVHGLTRSGLFPVTDATYMVRPNHGKRVLELDGTEEEEIKAAEPSS